MAKRLWAQIYYQDTFSGILKEESGDRMSFTYDAAYLSDRHPPIAHALPMQESPFISASGLHAFFDNLVSEGWMEEVQTRLLGKREASRFELLMAFGWDCAGAVSVVDPEPTQLTQRLFDDHMRMAVMAGRASLPGVQPKLVLIEDKKGFFRPTKVGELSTHIGKFPLSHHSDLVVNEYLSTQAFKALLPDDTVVDLTLGEVKGIDQQALIIRRFDRENNQRIHFEEFNQLLGKPSKEKYGGAHKVMADFLKGTTGTLKTDLHRLYRRILAGILLGNTDMHFKNFAMFHTPAGLRLTPSYDQVAAALYQYKTMALTLGGTSHAPIGKLKPSHIIRLGQEFSLTMDSIEMACGGLEKCLVSAKEAVHDAPLGDKLMKTQVVQMMEKRWNGTFALIGRSLSKKR